ncbi:uncharacterized protein LOC122314966 [Carya illinoinensis]|uniref:DUF538 family protein n=1 Tax=Carya illinoinensis TaxID=32201 RepID=A0A8T1PYZ4_CARIL|nr:uncharacterized protein LOC122314966 [Carya illinoinensis]KAG6646657.1 hypothetical protein CIPAW_07G022900 [Carya illinoinensis]KAG6702246.1 hypothetical protein I3842_07G023800 [Carya illinoinensis]
MAQLPFNYISSTIEIQTDREETARKSKKEGKREKMGFFFFAESFILSPTIICLLLFISTSLASETNPTTPTRSAYEVIQGYNFPVGILPKGVLGYNLDPSTGKFSAYLGGSCSFSLEGSYQLKYKSTIRGSISQGKLSSLEGVSVKLFFFWVDIVEVQRKGDSLGFSVGIAGADFPIDNFEECPQCGCGLNCNDGQLKEVRSIPIVSSYSK